MSTYVSCRCGWRGTSNTRGDHVCFRGGQADPAHRNEGWPDDLETHRRLGSDAVLAIRYPLAPPKGPRLASLRYTSTGLSFVFGNEESMAWFHGPGVWREVETASHRLTRENPKMTVDHRPGERPAPAGTATPALLAAAIQSHLRVQYPDEEIHIWSVSETAYDVMPRRSAR